MNINRFVVDLLFTCQGKQTTVHFPLIEEFLFHYLPRKVQFGGYGYVRLKIETGRAGENEIKAYGQCLDYIYKPSAADPELSMEMTVEEQFQPIVSIIGKVVEDLSTVYEIDFEAFQTALANCRANKTLRIEQPLKKISKWHKSRKVKVDFIRIIEPREQTIVYRILDKDQTLLKEEVIVPNASIYDASYNFRTSFWMENELLVFNRFEEQTFSLSVEEFLEPATKKQ